MQLIRHSLLSPLLLSASVQASDRCPGPPLPDPDRTYQATVAGLHKHIGIPADYADRTGLTLQIDNPDLVPVDVDGDEREFRMSPEAAAAWERLRAAAERDEVELILISAHRGLFEQATIVADHVDNGRNMAQILRLVTAPGYSEHHTGDAIDLTTTDTPALYPEFAETEAFAWLNEHAERYCFRLSYPADNPHNLAFEPWHWRFVREDG